MILAMLAGWEIVLILAVVMVLFSARYLAQPDIFAREAKKMLFYFFMTLAAVALGCLLALLVEKLGQ